MFHIVQDIKPFAYLCLGYLDASFHYEQNCETNENCFKKEEKLDRSSRSIDIIL